MRILILVINVFLLIGYVNAQSNNINTNGTNKSLKKEIDENVQKHIEAGEQYLDNELQTTKKAKSNGVLTNQDTTTAQPVQSFWKSVKEGWFWYKSPPVEEAPEEKILPEKPKQKIEPESKKPIKKQKTDLELFSEFQQKVDDARKIAIINPTLENVKNYRIMEQAAFDQSLVFAKQIGIVNSTEKVLNTFASGNFPTNPIGASVYVREQNKTKQALVNSLAETHGLFFFFRSDCPYCHAFAPILKQFQKDSKFKVIAISLDGAGIPHYPDPAPDQGIFKKFNIHTVPALVVAIPGNNKYQVINYGVTPYDEIYNKIYNFVVDKVDSPETPMKEVLGTVVLNNK